LRAGADVVEVFVVPEASEEIDSLAAAADVPVHRVSEKVLASVSDTATPQGVVARVRSPALSIGELELGAGLVVVLADVRDPGNAGTLMRSALAAGADGVVACSGAVDPLHPKTVRASAGAIFRISLVRGVDVGAAIEALSARGLVLVGADQNGAEAWTADLTRPLALVVGNEAWGLGSAGSGTRVASGDEDSSVGSRVRPALDEIVSIPMPGPTESLNAGIAGSVLLFEALRQRASVYPRNP
jgi:TrmH family RNA methyltransferase